jgi:hypothetical protein
MPKHSHYRTLRWIVNRLAAGHGRPDGYSGLDAKLARLTRYAEGDRPELREAKLRLASK